MRSRPKEQTFAERYRLSGTDPLIESELEVLGSDYQANGYTTMSQADDLGIHLRLRGDDRLLDIGAGCGWPGLYLAKKYGCDLVVIDPIIDGVRVAGARAVHDQMARRESGIQGLGSDLPFVERSFDAVVHADVVC